MTTEVCKHYLKGSCHHGKSCNFRHQKPLAAHKSPTQSTPCKFFAQGKCAYGQKCSRSHDVRARPNATTATATATASESGSNDGVKAVTPKSKSNQSSGKKQRPDASSSSTHQREDKSSSSDPQELAPSPYIADDKEKAPTPCVFFIQGLCQSGDSCPFSHSLESGDESRKGSSRGVRVGSGGDLTVSDSQPPQHQEKEKKTVCKHFLRGHCRLGNECKYEHDHDPQAQVDQTSPIIDKEISAINAGHQFSPSESLPLETRTPPSAPPRSPVPAGRVTVTPELDSGFEDMTMPDTTLNSPPEIQRRLTPRSAATSPKADSSDSQIIMAVTHNNDSDEDCQEEQQEEGLELGSYPAIRGKGKGKERDPGIEEVFSEEQWENERGSDRVFSPMLEDLPERNMDYPIEEQFDYPGEDQLNHDSDHEEQQDDSDDEQQVDADDGQLDDKSQPTRTRRGSYYGNGWEERELGSPLSPSVPQITQHTSIVAERIQTPTEVYPHISDVILHWSHFADPLADAAIPFCKLHAQGKCIQGDSCRFRHSLTPQEYTLLFHDQQPNLWTLTRTSPKNLVNGQMQSPSRLVPATPSHPRLPDQTIDIRPQAESTNASTTKECAFFRLGKCRNGDICPFRHIKPPEGHAVPSDSGWGQAQTPSSNSRPKSTRPCRFFLNKGFCDNGENCRFQHTQVPENPIETSSNGNGNGNNDNNNGWQSQWEENNDGEDVKNNDENGETIQRGAAEDPWGPPMDLSGWGDTIEQPADASPVASDQWPEDNGFSPSAPLSLTPAPICSYFLKGNCRKGDSCRYRHERSNTPSQTHGNATPTVQEETWSSPQNNANGEGNCGTAAAWSPQEPSQPTRKKINVPCRRFAEGSCKFGDRCDYLHVENTPSVDAATETFSEWQPTPLPPSVEPDPGTNDDGPAEDAEEGVEDSPQSNHELEPIVFDHPVVKTAIMTCEVTVGPDATPERIVSASDCYKIDLCGLPPEVLPTDVTALCSKHGHVKQVVSLDSSPTSSDVRVEFAGTAQAVIAARNLNGYIYLGAPLRASLKARIPLTIRNPDAPMLTLKIAWPNPTISAWTHYPTISKAKLEASRLNDTVYRSHTLKATFMTPLRTQKDAFSIRIERLPLDTTIAEVDELCSGNSSLVTLSRPSYTDDPVDAISAALDEFTGLEGFDPLPGNNQRGTATAFATFKSEGMARTIMEKLDSCQHAFLGNQALNIRPSYYSRHRLLREQMDALNNEIDRLVEASKKKCTVQIDDHPDKNFVWLRMYAPFDYGPSIHTELEELLAGTVLKDQDGSDLWDDYFDLPSSAKALKQLGTNAYIHCDHPAQKLKVFGASAERDEARKSILKLVAKVRSQKHEIEIPRTSLHPLINRTLAQLKTKIGLNKISLDVINSKLIVRGTSADVSEARSILGSLKVQPASGGHGICQVCLQRPLDTVTLSCHHNYCNQCLQFVIQQAGHGPVQCIAQCAPSGGQEGRCSGTVPFVVIRNVLSMEQEKEFLAFSFYHYVRSNPDQIFFCPSLNCQTAYCRSGERCVNLKCKFCLSDVCTYCRSLAHLGSACPP